MGQFVAVVSVGGLRPHSADKAFAVEHGSDVFVGIFLLFCVPVLAKSRRVEMRGLISRPEF